MRKIIAAGILVAATAAAVTFFISAPLVLVGLIAALAISYALAWAIIQFTG